MYLLRRKIDTPDPYWYVGPALSSTTLEELTIADGVFDDPIVGGVKFITNGSLANTFLQTAYYDFTGTPLEGTPDGSWFVSGSLVTGKTDSAGYYRGTLMIYGPGYQYGSLSGISVGVTRLINGWPIQGVMTDDHTYYVNGQPGSGLVGNTFYVNGKTYSGTLVWVPSAYTGGSNTYGHGGTWETWSGSINNVDSSYEYTHFHFLSSLKKGPDVCWLPMRHFSHGLLASACNFIDTSDYPRTYDNDGEVVQGWYNGKLYGTTIATFDSPLSAGILDRSEFNYVDGIVSHRGVPHKGLLSQTQIDTYLTGTEVLSGEYANGVLLNGATWNSRIYSNGVWYVNSGGTDGGYFYNESPAAGTYSGHDYLDGYQLN